LLNGFPGEASFCGIPDGEKFCERYDICDKKNYPKILDCCQIAIEYTNRNTGFQNYIWGKTYMDEPMWLLEMQSIINQERIELNKEK